MCLRVYLEAHRAELHLGDRLVPIPTLRRCGQADDIASFHFTEDALELDSGEVMTLVDDDLAIARDEISHRFPPNEALDHGYVNAAGRRTLRAGNLPDVLWVNAEKKSKLRKPLIEQRPTVDQNQCAARWGRDEIGADDRLANSRRCDENAGVVREQRLRG